MIDGLHNQCSLPTRGVCLLSSPSCSLTALMLLCATPRAAVTVAEVVWLASNIGSSFSQQPIRCV